MKTNILCVIALILWSVSAMAETMTGYRAFPPTIDHPRKAEVLSETAFTNLNAIKMQDAPSLCPGHEGTTVWYAGTNGYVIQIRIKGKKDIYARSICTFTPTMGMDKIDGVFAQDVEEYHIQKELGLKSTRLDAFNGNDSLSIEDYLRTRGVLKK